MASKKFEKDDIIYSASSDNDEICIITEGAVFASAAGVKYTLGKGDVIGAVELGFDAHFISYMATENTSVIYYQTDSIELLLEQNNDFSAYFFKSINRQINFIINQFYQNKNDAFEQYDFTLDAYDRYKTYCLKCGSKCVEMPQIVQKGEFIDDSDVNPHIQGFYKQINLLIKDGRNVSADYLMYFAIKTSKDARSVCLGAKKAFIYLTQISKFLVDESQNDLLGLFSDLYFENSSDEEISSEVSNYIDKIFQYLDQKSYINQNIFVNRKNAYQNKIDRTRQLKDIDGEDADIFNELADSVDKITLYANFDENLSADLKSLLSMYKQMKDYSAVDDSSRHLRADITNIFYKLYEKVFFVALNDYSIPKYVLMFLEFGFLDEQLVSKEDTLFMYKKAGTKYADPDKKVFTFFEWLKAIYRGDRLPSKNEFDVDFESYIHEKKVKNQISEADEKRFMSDRKAMVLYELKNMFLSANKVTFGRISIYCPVYNSANMIGKIAAKSLDTSIILKNIDYIRNIDFRLFYRESLYQNAKLGITSEYINVEVLPDIILMPNAGSRGLMWQEIQGRVRTTPARIILPVIDLEDVKHHILHACGEYRWEMCKRIQGGRWNDVTDPSLTSEYFDYVQFYRKNHDLSTEAKEKVKMALTRAKNSFKEMFIFDYMIYVMYESDGAPRLNKVARSIIGKYCPFPKDTRNAIRENPTYKDIISYYENHEAQKIHRLNNLIVKIQNSGENLPKEIMNEVEFLNK